MISIEWTQEKKDAVIKIIEKYIIDHKVTCGESVMQNDEANIDSMNVMADIVDIIEPETHYED